MMKFFFVLVGFFALFASANGEEWEEFNFEKNRKLLKKISSFTRSFENCDYNGRAKFEQLPAIVEWQQKISKVSGLKYDFGSEGILSDKSFKERAKNGKYIASTIDANSDDAVESLSYGYTGTVFFIDVADKDLLIISNEEERDIYPNYRQLVSNICMDPFLGNSVFFDLTNLDVLENSAESYENISYFVSGNNLKLRIKSFEQNGRDGLKLFGQYTLHFTLNDKDVYLPSSYSKDSILRDSAGKEIGVPNWKIVFSDYLNNNIGYLPKKIEGYSYGTVSNATDLIYGATYTAPNTTYTIRKMLVDLDKLDDSSNIENLNFKDIFTEGKLVADRISGENYRLGNPLKSLKNK